MTVSANRGFTLLELLIAVALFAVLSAAAYIGFNSILRSNQVLSHDQQLTRLSLALLRLETDLRHLISRPPGSQPTATFSGSADTATWSRVDPDQYPGTSAVTPVSYYFDGQTLLRRIGHDTQQPQLPNSALLDDLESFSLAYYSFGNWQSQWPPNDAVRYPPQAIKIQLTHTELGEFTRLIQLSGDR